MRDSQAQRSELILLCAILAAHAMHRSGFRQRDVKFLLDLFSNWLEYLPVAALAEWQSTQIQRFLDSLVMAVSMRRSVRGKVPIYRLTRSGLIGCLEGVVRGRTYGCREQFFFLFYFVKNYRPLLEQMIQSEGGAFPPALQIEVSELCDLNGLVQQELREVDLLIRKLDGRILLAENVSELAERSRKANRPLVDTIAEIEQRYPYDLNSQRPLDELIMQLPESQRRWELEHGNLQRVREIWRPMRAMLAVYRQQVQTLVGS